MAQSEEAMLDQKYGLPISDDMGSMYGMKTTVEISDALLLRAKKHARRTHRSLRALIEQGLQKVMEEESKPQRYRLPDRSIGQEGGVDPLEALNWAEIRDEIYGGR